MIPEHIPVHDVMKMRAYAVKKGVFALVPTTPGILVPGKGKMGIMPASLFAPGRTGIISRSGTLSYEFEGILSECGVGQSTVVGMGADPVVLTHLVDILQFFEEDKDTDGVIIVGEVGGDQEEKAARFIQEKMTKPVAAYLAGRRSPEGKRMGHAGAIVRGSAGTVDAKEEGNMVTNEMARKASSRLWLGYCVMNWGSRCLRRYLLAIVKIPKPLLRRWVRRPNALGARGLPLEEIEA